MASRFFALVIGINQYPGLKRNTQIENDLGGACNDARNICEWLIQYVLPGTDNSHITLQDLLEGNKDSNITLLLDTKATREEIIKRITALSNNDNIQPGDPILIFYAGHGSVAKTPPSWRHTTKGGDGESGGQSLIEVLLPHDVYTPRDAPYEQQVQPIPDITMNLLLRELAQKSDNITVILDCCHSAGITRNGLDDEDLGKSREIKLEKLFGTAVVLPEKLDENIKDREKKIFVKGDNAFDKGDQNSHVLLAACGDQETAREDHPGSGETQGCFTRAFLKEVKDTTRGDISYSILIEEFPQLTNWKGDPLKFQHPQCKGGANVDRILFDGKLPVRDPAFIPIHVDHSAKTTYTLDVGDADGIVQGSKFTVHQKFYSSDEPEICTMSVTDVQPFSATLVPDDPTAVDKLRKRIYAKQADWTEQQELRIHCTSALKNELDDGILTASRPGQFDRETGLRFVDTEAVLIVDIEEGKVVFDYLMGTLIRLPVQADPTHEQLLPLLHRAVRWNWDLTRGSPSVTTDVALVFTGLREIKKGFRAGELEPDGNNLNITGAVRLNKGENYGFTLTNYIKADLHVKIFWFDTTLVIDPIYRGATGRKQEVDPTLRANKGVFPVGYGAPGVPSLSFWEASVGDTPLGFIRVFIQDRDRSERNPRTDSIDSSISHSTLLPKSPNMGSRLARKLTTVAKDKQRWYTITLPIIVK